MLSQFLLYAVAFLVAIAIIINIHELGHFFAARALGVKVLRYSFGFGKPIWSRRGEDGTEYAIGAYPFIGGYVAMLGERDEAVDPGDRDRAFSAKPAWARAVILLAGPLANLLFAVAAYWVLFVAGVPGVRPIVGEVAPDGYAAAAGLSYDETIVAVEGQETGTWEAVVLTLYDAILEDREVELEVVTPSGVRQPRVLDLSRAEGLTEPGQLLSVIGIRPWSPRYDTRIGEVRELGPAAGAGMQAGDRILAIDGHPVELWTDMASLIRERPGERIEFRIERDGSELSLIVPVEGVEQDGLISGRIGILPLLPEGVLERLRAVQRYGPAEAAVQAVSKTWELSTLTLRLLGNMVMGEVSLRNVQGPIGIAQYAGYSAQGGWSPFLKFLAIVSISIGVLNLLPIPVLDGGQLLFLAVEKVKGSPLSDSARAFGQLAGLAVIVLMMGLAFYNDILGLLGSQ